MIYLQNILIKIGFGILGLIPTTILVRIFYRSLLLIGYRKQVINNNYKSTIGKDLSKSTNLSFYKKCVLNIARITVETLKLQYSKNEEINYGGIEELENKCLQNNGLLLLASHYGNWELACILLAQHTSIPCYGVYKPLKNKVLDTKIKDLRSSYGLKLIPMNTIARVIAENYNSGIPAIYILISDQNPRSIQNVEWIDFLGIMTAFSKGPGKFVKKYKLPLAYMKIKPGKNVYNYDISFELAEKVDADMTLKWYADQLASQIKTAPEYWLWSHKRWKRKYKPLEHLEY